MRASRPSRVSTRSSRWGPTVFTPRRRSSVRCSTKRIEQLALPAADVLLADHQLIRNPGQTAIGRPDELVEGADQAFAGRHQDLPRVGQALVPYVERAGHVRADPPSRLAQQGGALAQHPLHLVGRPGSLGVDQAQRVVEQFAADARPSTHQRQVLGREDGARRRHGQVLAPAGGLAVHLGAAPAGRARSRPPPVSGLASPRSSARTMPRSAPGAHHGLPGGAPEGTLGPEIDHGLEHAGLPRPVRAADHGRPLGLGGEDRRGEDYENRGARSGSRLTATGSSLLKTPAPASAGSGNGRRRRRAPSPPATRRLTRRSPRHPARPRCRRSDTRG